MGINVPTAYYLVCSFHITSLRCYDWLMKGDSVTRILALKTLLSLCFLWALPCVANAAPFSSIVIDATSGRTLQQYRAHQQRYPASLTKLMTVYLMMEEIEKGRLKHDTPIYVSRNASRQPASKLGLRRGSHIEAGTAMQALIVKSANDVATAVAEHISGSEAKFARRMSATARRLGLYDTRFTNASGLYHWRQQSTARDMARLAQALLERFPHFERVWQSQSFAWNGKTYRSHNRVMRRLPGALGMKTGYIRASGYNIATAVQRDGKRVIVVVIGGSSSGVRDNQAISLAERSLPRASTFKPQTPAAEKLHLAALWLDTPAEKLAQPNKGMDLAGLPKDWKIQVGAYSASNHARSQLQRVERVLGPQLGGAKPHTEPAEKNGRPIYRARFANLSENQALSLCDKLRDVSPGCMAISPH